LNWIEAEFVRAAQMIFFERLIGGVYHARPSCGNVSAKARDNPHAVMR
jgi:hypothetical protein